MTLKELSNHSVFLSSVRNFLLRYSNFEKRLLFIYRFSKTYNTYNNIWGRTRVYFNHSRLRQIFDVKPVPSGIINNSRFVQYFMSCYRKWKDKPARYIKASSTTAQGKNVLWQLSYSPLLVISIIIIVTILVNIFLSLALHNQISHWGWFVRGLFLFIALIALFCKADWAIVKGNSKILRKLKIY